MSELLHDNSELFEDDQGHDSGVAGLAVDGLSLFVGEQDDGIDDTDTHDEESDYD